MAMFGGAGDVSFDGRVSGMLQDALAKNREGDVVS
jgi:hypothetical protein